MAEWVILELSPRAENEDPALVRSSIRHQIRDAEVFIPASVTQIGEDKVVQYLVDGYAFIRRAHQDEKYFRLEGSRYVQAVVTTSGPKSGLRSNRVISCVQDADIARFQRQLHVQEDQGISVGDTVLVINGPYRHLDGVIVEDIPETESVQVKIGLRSKDDLVTLPRSFLRLLSKSTNPQYPSRVRELRAWFDVTSRALRWNGGGYNELQSTWATYLRLHTWIETGGTIQTLLGPGPNATLLPLMRSGYEKVRRLSWWIDRGARIQAFIRALTHPFSLDEVRQLVTHLEHLTVWTRRWEELLGLVRPLLTPVASAAFESKFLEWGWFQDALERFGEIERAVLSIEREMSGSTMVDNIVIDGYNMAARCSMAPGLSDLRDSKGRPTGAIVGFLNSVNALQKKFPGAAVWICWDTPSQRRRRMFSAYKANRNPLRLSFEVAWLQEHLGKFGLWQVYAEGEEADDVMATLVRTKLDGQRNVIVSTDRDLLQLVTDTTHVYVPVVGSSKEKYFTPSAVQAAYGVTPDRMVHLRALSGDSSDNIPGAPGCGDKTAPKLLQLYGTIDGIYSSNLAGMTPSLREKIRGAEAQVRLNVRLMTLVGSLALTVHEPTLDQEAASARLQDVDVNPARIISAYFKAPEASCPQQATLFQ